MPPYRLPLELELQILELATPPLLMDHLAKRVEFLQAAALVHRSFTKWAQDKLHQQFVYTFRRRVDEQERLQERLTAGFGSPPSRALSRLYFDLRAWVSPASWRFAFLSDDESTAESSSGATGPASAAEDPAPRAPSGRMTVNDAIVSVSSRWKPYALIQPWLLRLDAIWFVVPPRPEPEDEDWEPRCAVVCRRVAASRAAEVSLDLTYSTAGARYVELDDHVWDRLHHSWEGMAAVLPASLTTLVLRDTYGDEMFPTFPSLKNLILVDSSLCISMRKNGFAEFFPKLDKLTSIGRYPIAPWLLLGIAVLARTAEFYTSLQVVFDSDFDAESDNMPVSPQRLGTCTFILLPPDSRQFHGPNPFASLEALSEKIYDGTECTVRCTRLEATVEEVVERVLADLVI